MVPKRNGNSIFTARDIQSDRKCIKFLSSGDDFYQQLFIKQIFFNGKKKVFPSLKWKLYNLFSKGRSNIYQISELHLNVIKYFKTYYRIINCRKICIVLRQNRNVYGTFRFGSFYQHRRKENIKTKYILRSSKATLYNIHGVLPHLKIYFSLFKQKVKLN